MVRLIGTHHLRLTLTYNMPMAATVAIVNTTGLGNSRYALASP